MIKRGKEGVILKIYVQPRAKRTEIEGVDEWRGRLKVRVKAPPVGGKANREIEKFFSKLLGTQVSIIKGMTSREKDLLVREATVEEVKDRLGIYL